MSVDSIIKQGVERGAQNIYIAPNAKPIFKIDGDIAIQQDMVFLDNEAVSEMLDTLLTEPQLTLLHQTGEINVGYSLQDVGRLRVNVVRQRGSFALSFKLHHTALPSIDNLNIPDVFTQRLHEKNGLILVCGASGTGRSTTMAAMVQYINETRSAHIMTIESPLEYLIRHDKSIVLQRDVGTDCSTIEDGMRSAFLHDPDVVVVSELTSEDVVDMALRLVESGKLVIAGYTAKNSLSAIEKIVYAENQSKSQIRRHQFAHTFLGVITQQLIPSLDGDKRILCYELLLANPAVRAYLMSNELSEIQNTLIAGKRQGMISMDTHLFNLYQQGAISHQHMVQYAQDIEFIKRLEKAF